MKQVRIGCSGWSYESWRQGLYREVPARRRLERYAEVFDTVEVNATFYRLPKPETVVAWVEQVPEVALGDDARRPLPPASPAGEVAYLRLHYGGRGRDGNYSSAELDRWRRRVAAWRSRREVYVYLNNDWNEFAPANARELRRGLSPAAA